jgi:flagellar biosynthesis/type III secretory pathway protein FliH
MSTIIKASGPTPALDAGAFNFDDLGGRAKAYLEEVRRQAAEILAQAQQDAIDIRRRAEEQGQTAALEAAERLCEEKLARQTSTLMPALRDVVSGIHHAQSQWLMHWERTAIHVAAAIASRIIRRELRRTPDVTLALVREALELAAGSAAIQLRMHPDDLESLGKEVESLTSELARLGKPEIVADAQIEKGGCRLDTRMGTIDQQFAAQLARIEEELT